MSAYCPPPLRSRPYIGAGANDVQVFNLKLAANQLFLDVAVNLAQPADTIFYSSFSGGISVAQLGFSFQPVGIQLQIPNTQPTGALISLSQGVMWRFDKFKTLYLTGKNNVTPGTLTICFLNGMNFHSESS